MIRNFGRADVRAARAERKRKGRARCALRTPHHRRRRRRCCRDARYTVETRTRSPGTRDEEEEYREERATEEGERKLWRAGFAVITSAGLNGGISRYLWHNFTGFTMAYIRGPVERISPRGIHTCPTETFVIPCLRPAR